MSPNDSVDEFINEDGSNKSVTVLPYNTSKFPKSKILEELHKNNLGKHKFIDYEQEEVVDNTEYIIDENTKKKQKLWLEERIEKKKIEKEKKTDQATKFVSKAYPDNLKKYVNVDDWYDNVDRAINFLKGENLIEDNKVKSFVGKEEFIFLSKGVSSSKFIINQNGAKPMMLDNHIKYIKNLAIKKTFNYSEDYACRCDIEKKDLNKIMARLNFTKKGIGYYMGEDTEKEKGYYAFMKLKNIYREKAYDKNIQGLDYNDDDVVFNRMVYEQHVMSKDITLYAEIAEFSKKNIRNEKYYPLEFNKRPYFKILKNVYELEVNNLKQKELIYSRKEMGLFNSNDFKEWAKPIKSSLQANEKLIDLWEEEYWESITDNTVFYTEDL